MKKLLVTLAAVLVSVSSFAQGTLVFNNRGLTGPNNTTYNAPINGETVGATAQLFLVGAGGVRTEIPGVNSFRPAPNNAFLTGPVTVSVPNQPPGTANLQLVMRAWQGASYDSATVRGESAVFTVGALGGVPPAGGAPITPPDLGGPGGVGGFQSFDVIPEPSTIALGLLGAAALLLRRRK